ncbi:mycothiol conjugate amidase Mca [Actinomarinicola tropica]|uniref:Mycothiol conjugate amidase Mca n=1 Tax=Actinomarinicola tropica TaxID=2789776 RepID=A0A5Q2RJN3_9ACTN|nr:mycothiol conjugate amidase Mca [Actinomarinicola tropica]QGG94771.1 mycothiol conjugate amidase Mca [Actinomarinicola tropica]
MARPVILTVHAHPDDESSKGAPTIAKYRAAGAHTVLVCCTGGEEGSILNPAMDTEEVRADIAGVRERELDLAASVIGYEVVERLGYRDSGMAGEPSNDHPDCFWKADLDEAIGRLVAVIRRERPQVVVTYSDDQRGYEHPDHLRVHDITVPAFERAADPEWYPEAGEPWQPLKLYYTTWSRARMVAMHEKYLELGLESPFAERFLDTERRPDQDHRITTQVPVDGYMDARTEGLLAHATQVDPESPFWFGLPRDVANSVHPYDDYILARSLVESAVPEDDLFAGIPDLDWEPLS